MRREGAKALSAAFGRNQKSISQSDPRSLAGLDGKSDGRCAADDRRSFSL
jgi:hypothetical protein